MKGAIRLNPNQSNLLTRMFQYLLKVDQPFSTPPELAAVVKHFVVPQTNAPKEKAAKRYFCLNEWQIDDWVSLPCRVLMDTHSPISNRPTCNRHRPDRDEPLV